MVEKMDDDTENKNPKGVNRRCVEIVSMVEKMDHDTENKNPNGVNR